MANACYEIGDVGPAGGIIFALPYTGVNQTKYHYEIALEDVNEPTFSHNWNAHPSTATSTTYLGTEWGSWNLISSASSTAFGDGSKNTDFINLVGVFPGPLGNTVGGTTYFNPYYPGRDIAGRQCRQHAQTGPDGTDYNDWFLPSLDELKEAKVVSDDLGLDLFEDSIAIGGSSLVFWTSSEYNEYKAKALHMTPAAYVPSQPSYHVNDHWKAHAFSVRPIRRFLCKDEGITYDYRLDTKGQNSMGSIYSISNLYNSPNPLDVRYNTGPTFTFSPQGHAYTHSHPSGNIDIGMNSFAIMFSRSLTNSDDPGAFPGVNLPNGLIPAVGDIIESAWTPVPGPGSNFTNSLGLISKVILDTDPNAASLFNDINTPASSGGFYGAGASGVNMWSDPANNTYNFPGHEPFDHSITIDTILVFDNPLSNGWGIDQPSQNQSGYDPINLTWNFYTQGVGLQNRNLSWGPYPTGTRFGHTSNISGNLNKGVKFYTQVPNTMYSPDVFGSKYEIGHPVIYFSNVGRFDIRGNDLHGLSYSPDRLDGYGGEIFNIKIYSQYEELLGDWDYKLKKRLGGFGCGVSHCYHHLWWELISTNYVYSGAVGNIVDLKVYHEGLAGTAGHPEGWVYVSLECKTKPSWNAGMQRGNTLNLENWRNTGVNKRTKSINDPIPTWPWQKAPCGKSCHAPPNCQCFRIRCGRYKAEIDPYPIDPHCPQFSWANPNHLVMFGSFSDCQVGATSITNGSSAKLLGPSENYPNEINQCFEDGEKEVDVSIYTDENKILSKRERFVKNKSKKETGPFSIAGFYPLYDTPSAAAANSPTFYESRDKENTYGYHIHEFEGIEYYMPNGLEMGITQFHGDYDGHFIQEYSSIETEQREIGPVEPQEIPNEQPPDRPTDNESTNDTTSNGGY